MGLNTFEAIASDYATYGDLQGGWVPDASVAASAWTPYDLSWKIVESSPVVTTTKTVETDPGSGLSVMRATASAGGDDAHREFVLRSDANYVYSEIRSVIYGHGTWADSNGLTQQGHIHRAQKYGPNGQIRAFVAWHDAFIGLPQIINVGLWDGRPGAQLNLHNTNQTFTMSPVARHPVTYSNRASNVVTVHVPTKHWIDVNSHVDVVLPTGDLGATNVAVASVNGPLITYADTGDNGVGGGGYITKHSSTNPYGPLSTFPFVLVSRLIRGDILQAKIYRLGEAEPPWSTGVTYRAGQHVNGVPFVPDYQPTGPGYNGLLLAHMRDGEIVHYGNPQIRELSI